MSQSLNNSDSHEVTSWPPRWLTPVPDEALERGDGAHFLEFGEAYCRTAKESIAARAGELMTFRPWQKLLLSSLLARGDDGFYRHRTALVGMARKNGKSALGSTLALGGLLLGPQGGEVYSCAGDKEQARIVFGVARRMVELDPEMSDMLKLYRDAIEFPETGSIYRVLSAEAYTKEGLNPTLVLFDEVHVQPNRDLWDVMALAMGARPEPLLCGITTAGVKTDNLGQESLCYTLYQYGQRIAKGEVDDPSHFMAWWEPRDPSADHRDPATWREANPGYDDIVGRKDFEASVLQIPEPEFRTKRCNQWVASGESFLPVGTWDACRVEGKSIPDGSRVVLGFDGSKTGDSTGIVAVSVEEVPHVQVVGVWEHPPDDSDWRIDRNAVKDRMREACKRWNVLEVPWDPYLWLDAAEELREEGIPIEEFPQTADRMGRATQRLYELVVNGQLTHDGDLTLARHLENAVLKVDTRGWRIVKEKPHSKRWIDLAVCTEMGLDRAAWWQANEDVAFNIW